MSIGAINQLNFIFNSIEITINFQLQQLDPLVLIKLLAKTAHENNHVISDKQQRFESI